MFSNYKLNPIYQALNENDKKEYDNKFENFFHEPFSKNNINDVFLANKFILDSIKIDNALEKSDNSKNKVNNIIFS